MRSMQELLSLARRIHAVYERKISVCERDADSDWEGLERRFYEVQRQRRIIQKAKMHGWRLAVQQLQAPFASALRGCSEAANEVRDRWIERPPEVPSLRDLLGELQQLGEEFGTPVLDDRKNFIAIQTKAIVLEGIYLGEFLIRLHWPRLAEKADSECFEVVAADPHPAGNNPNVTHPHVKNNSLCAGEATRPLALALEQGRLVDAFCLIRSVLETYNSGSAHVSLENWEGVSCWNCGYEASGDDTYLCGCCEHDVCYDCTSSCNQCDRSYCSSCQTRCDVCEEPCCHRCLQKSACSEISCCAGCLRVCAVCEAEVAPSEFDKATARCLDCQEQEDEHGGDFAPQSMTASP